ncbi:hypothetical protein K438DRAFT_1619522, partial [Mycena galopus ATCC 62051]
FLRQADHIYREARFVIDSMPNVEDFAVERALQQLQAVHGVLATMEDPSTQNIRMERNWRDVRKDTIQVFREISEYLEETELLEMDNAIHRVCLFLVFQPRIQASLDRTRDSWNLHKIRTARHRTPVAIYALSREKAIRLGYWTGDPGDSVDEAAQPGYGVDLNSSRPPLDEVADDPQQADHEEMDPNHEREAGIFVNHYDEIAEVRETLNNFDFKKEDDNYGIKVYCEAVLLATAYFSSPSN